MTGSAEPQPWREAWETALYGDDGFFRRQAPADHFRTSVNASELFAAALWQLVRESGLGTVVDVGAAGGELLVELDRLSGGTLTLIGVDLADRPAGLTGAIEWRHDLPPRIDGLLIANEWLDNVPCDVVELDADGVVRQVLVDPATGAESLGGTYDSPWLREWWPLSEAGERAEVGDVRDAAWADAVSRVSGTAIAIDYGHTRANRPPFGTLRSYAGGREVDVVPDGSRDITAHVAVDSVAAAAGATMIRQRDALTRLGIDAARPPLELAHSDPGAYVRALASAGEAGELMAGGGLGDFWWLVTDTLGHGTLLS